MQSFVLTSFSLNKWSNYNKVVEIIIWAIEFVVGRAAGLYDALQMEDVGKQSHYQEIRQDQNASETSYEGRSIYNILHTVWYFTSRNNLIM